MTTTGPPEPPGDPDIPGLSRYELEQTFLRDITLRLVQPDDPQTRALPVRQDPRISPTGSHPEVVFLVAQPHAGTLNLRDNIQREFDDRGGIVTVLPDNFRAYHPAYEHALATDPGRIVNITDPAARWWADRSLEWLREEMYHVLVEDSSADPDEVMQSVDRFAAAGYQVRIAALAVPAAQSRIAIIENFVVMAETVGLGAGPWTSAETHDAAYRGVAEVLYEAEASQAVSRITIDTLDGPVHDVEQTAVGEWRHRGPAGERLHVAHKSALKVLHEARREPPSPIRREALVNRLGVLRARLEQKGLHYDKVDEMAYQVVRDLTGVRELPRQIGLLDVDELLPGLRDIADQVGMDFDSTSTNLGGPNRPDGPEGPQPPPPSPDPGPDIGPDF